MRLLAFLCTASLAACVTVEPTATSIPTEPNLPARIASAREAAKACDVNLIESKARAVELLSPLRQVVAPAHLTKFKLVSGGLTLTDRLDCGFVAGGSKADVTAIMRAYSEAFVARGYILKTLSDASGRSDIYAVKFGRAFTYGSGASLYFSKHPNSNYAGYWGIAIYSKAPPDINP